MFFFVYFGSFRYGIAGSKKKYGNDLGFKCSFNVVSGEFAEDACSIFPMMLNVWLFL